VGPARFNARGAALVRISPATSDLRHALPTGTVDELVDAIGMERYDTTCLRILDRYFDADHWALFHYRGAGPVSCVASASKAHAAAAQSNVRQFIDRCHRVDPSLIALRRQRPESACVAEMQAGDISDRQYRRCFDLARVKERVSLFLRFGSDLYQLSIYRCTHNRPLDTPDIRNFSALASVIVRSGTKHERLSCSPLQIAEYLDVGSIGRLLQHPSFGLSRRESEVCALAAAGRTIDQSACELDIARTSVVTYRQRGYGKLKVSRQSELVALINNMRACGP
jgi:DNA-binding CsgD family transcriptional regulator